MYASWNQNLWVWFQLPSQQNPEVYLCQVTPYCLLLEVVTLNNFSIPKKTSITPWHCLQHFSWSAWCVLGVSFSLHMLFWIYATKFKFCLFPHIFYMSLHSLRQTSTKNVTTADLWRVQLIVFLLTDYPAWALDLCNYSKVTMGFLASSLISALISASSLIF